MKTSLEKTSVRDIGYLINTSFLRADRSLALEKLASMLCTSDRYKVYLENADGRLAGVVQAKQIAVKILELSRMKSDEEDLLPAIAYVLNFHHGHDIAEKPVMVHGDTPLRHVIELMQLNHIREIAVVDEQERMIGTLEAKNVLSHYLQAIGETAF